MRTLEENFIKEFKQTYYKGNCSNIYEVPVPELDIGVSGTDIFAIKGIEKEHYSLLNNTLVRKVPKGYKVKRRKIDKIHRSFQKDATGKYVYEDFPIPRNTIAVLSDKNIELPYSEYKSMSKDGYNYVDFVGGPKNKDFIYTIPTNVLYKVHQTALVISERNMKNYSGWGFRLFHYGLVYLHVIPYNPNSAYTGSKVLCTKGSRNYKTEIAKIVGNWINTGLLVPFELGELSDGSNLTTAKTQVGYETYEPVESLALSDMQVYGEDESES